MRTPTSEFPECLIDAWQSTADMARQSRRVSRAEAVFKDLLYALLDSFRTPGE